MVYIKTKQGGDDMNMAKILNYKFSEEIDREICKNQEYIKENKEINKFIRKEFPNEKAEYLVELVGEIVSVIGDAYVEEGIRIGAKSLVALFLE